MMTMGKHDTCIFNRIFLISKLVVSIFIILFVLSPEPSESARCVPCIECWLYPNPVEIWPDTAHQCPCSGEICDFGINEYSCDDGCLCNRDLSAQIIARDCIIFCETIPIPFQECTIRIAGNLCSTWFQHYYVHIFWYEVFGDYTQCGEDCFNNCDWEDGDRPECGVTLCRCPRG